LAGGYFKTEKDKYSHVLLKIMEEQNEEYERPRLFDDIRGIELKEGKHDELCIAGGP
jgi:hypothetical protein